MMKIQNPVFSVELMMRINVDAPKEIIDESATSGVQVVLNISSVEDAIGNRLSAVQDEIVNIDFILNIATIADAVQPETDNLLKKL